MRGLLLAFLLLAGPAMAQPLVTKYGPGPVPSLPLTGGIVTGTISLDKAGIGGIPNTSINAASSTIIFRGGAGANNALADQFEIASPPGVIEQWRAVGGAQHVGPAFFAKSLVSTDNVSGVFAAQNTGGFVFGNGSGFLATMVNSGGGNDTWFQMKAGSSSGGTNTYPILSAVGTANTRIGIYGLGAGEVLLGNDNGILGVFHDPNGAGVAHNAYWQIEPGTTTGPPSFRVVSSDASEGGTVIMQGSGGLAFNNGNGALFGLSDGNASGTAVVARLNITSAISAGAPTTLAVTAGSASNSGMRLTTLGTGTLDVITNSTTQARVVGVASAARTVDLYGGTSSGSPTISPSAGNLFLGVTAPATNATEGFVQIGAMAGTPTGAPSNSAIGATITWDSTNKKICVYDTAWHCTAALTP